MQPTKNPRVPTSPARRNAQAGFSMVEMLMTASILAIGILGLTMLQVMSLRASRGSRSLTTAVQVGEAVMDQVEMEGRLSWLNITDSQYDPGAITPLTTLNYVDKAGPIVNQFNIKGQIPHASADPSDLTPYFTVTTRRINPVVVTTGQMHDFVVTVTFVDAVDATTGVGITRTATFTRRILHG